MGSLIPCTNKNQIVTANKQSFINFLETYEAIGGEVDEVNTYLIKRSIDKHGITIAQLEQALLEAYETCQYKLRWSDVMRVIKQNKSEVVPLWLQ